MDKISISFCILFVFICDTSNDDVANVFGAVPNTSNSLDALCKKFNIDLSKRQKHNALLDCELLREVYINLLDVKEPKFNLSSSNLEINLFKNKNYNKQIVDISDAELNNHKEFLKKEMKKNFYWILFDS